MSHEKPTTDPHSTRPLRKRVEELLDRTPRDLPSLPPGEVRSLVRDLSVHLAELGEEVEHLHRLNATLEQRVAEQLAEIGLQARAIESLGEGVLITGDDLDWPDSQIVFVNDAMCRITGCADEELIGRSPQFLRGDESDREALETMRADLHEGRSSRCEIVCDRRDGSTYDAELLVTPLLDADGRRTNFVAVVRDVTERNRTVEAVRVGRERMRALLNTASDGIVTIDGHGIIDNVNPAVERMFGYPRAELVGRNVSLLMPSPYREEHDDYLARYHETGEARIIGIGREVVGRHADGHTFPIDLAVSEIDHMHMFTGVIRDISERRRLQEHVLTIAAEEQQWIGRELHDGVGQELVGLGMMAETLATALARGVTAPASTARKLADGLRAANMQVRTLARGLFPVEVDPQGLRTALANLGRQVEERTGISCVQEVPRNLNLADGRTSTQLYRIAQEATNNAVRHGRPRTIRMRILVDERWVTLEVVDDGIGIGSADRVGEGLGMRIMRYRAGLLGGRLRVEGPDSGGTVVSCIVPVQPVNAAGSNEGSA